MSLEEGGDPVRGFDGWLVSFFLIDSDFRFRHLRRQSRASKNAREPPIPARLGTCLNVVPAGVERAFFPPHRLTFAEKEEWRVLSSKIH